MRMRTRRTRRTRTTTGRRNGGEIIAGEKKKRSVLCTKINSFTSQLTTWFI